MSTEPGSGATGTTGLSALEAAIRLERDGPNILPVPAPTPAWRQFAGELFHFFALLFWVAGALAFVAGLPQLGVAVFIVILLNAVFAFAQQQRAQRAAERLRDLLPRRATVVRDGRPVEISAEELVVGDLIALEGGDRVSADLELTVVHALTVDTSMLTGESAPTRPEPGDALYAGCFAVEGQARAVVTATAGATRLAEIASLTHTQHPHHTPIRKELDRVSRLIAAVAITVGVVFFGVALLVGTPASDGFLFAVGVTVAVVPEGLLPTVTLALAIGAQRMAARRALARNLEAVETLGSTTFICTDKTGTITRNEMAVVGVWTPRGSVHVGGTGYEPTGTIDVTDPLLLEDLSEIARVATRCSTGRAVEEDGAWVPLGDPMEAALDVLARRSGVDIERDAAVHVEVRRFPFDPRRRRMSVVAGGSVLVKGAPDAVLPRCVVPPGATDALERLAGRGLRVLAVARRAVGATLPDSADAAEKDLDLLGLIALEDPPRESAAFAIAECRRAGVKVAMVTGDHPSTARAIAEEVGLAGSDGLVVVGHDLPDDEAVLGALVDRDGVVVARVSPEDKLRIARALRARGNVVAMTGDGVNDAPALHEADIGIAMGRSGTDVAREAADLVLLDDDFATVVAAIEQGRSTFSNIRRFLTYHLTDNVAELTPFVVWALSGGRFPLAIGVLQVLALDIVTDILPALALGAEPPGAHLLEGPPIRRHLLDRGLFVRAFGVLGPVEAFVSLLAFVMTFVAEGWRPGESFPTGPTLLAASGAAFTAIVLGQAANAFACRSTVLPPWRIGWTTNRLLLWAVGAELAMLVGFLYFPPLADLLGQAPPSGAGFGVALLAMPAVLAADAIQKARLRRRRSLPRERTARSAPSLRPADLRPASFRRSSR